MSSLVAREPGFPGSRGASCGDEGTDRLTEQVLSIPVHPSLSDDEVAQVIGAVNETAEELGTR